ncbi:MAG: aminopeptidase P N-terminal domain-containing protein [Polyangia bacterium]|jgi:Xaa-Pro aminopeptidase|nr:aminopeptidase P N-terminal domain-containing protein [Polyangia bacterium]
MRDLRFDFDGRRRLLLSTHADTVFILPGAPRARRAHDVEHRYRPDSELFYLTGWTGPDSLALLGLSAGKPRLVLFVPERDPEAELWTGPRPGLEDAIRDHGADEAHPIGELTERLPALLVGARTLAYALGRDRASDDLVLGALGAARTLANRQGRPCPGDVRFPEQLLGALRVSKDEQELAAMRRACSTSAAGHLAAIRATRPGLFERDLEAVLELTFRRRGAAGAASPCIVAGGANATTLHYDANEDPLRPGELVLVDAGAEEERYAGDITRTFPVGGRFTPLQRKVYKVVSRAQREAKGAVRPGATLGQIHEVATLHLLEGLCSLGVLAGEPEKLITQGAHRPFYPHRTSHWLGLDVHDPGPSAPGEPDPPLAPGMVLTVEPGLYFPAGSDGLPPGLAGLGIRLEDDLIVTPDGSETLTAEVPLEPDDLEDLVGSGPLPPP